MSSRSFAPAAYPQVRARAIPGAETERARGYAAGYADGTRKAQEEHIAAEAVRQQRIGDAIERQQRQVDQAVAAIRAAIGRLNARQAPVIQDADDALVEAGLELAEAILGREVAEGHVTAADTLRRALAAVADEQVVAVHMSPADVSLLAGANTGDAQIRMTDGFIDARICAALDRARIVLTGTHA
ncbi:hypothetical protein ATY41_09830 [Leifsonia xyli subsp. xyli]|uniref:Uncharacterized protein n=2 Tax=Leifsonia xyli subsp. xyli TaxID=59736 RepID=Q6AGA6_LEIXX|nr:FliH/SctL family protein [Leifsonia xyli]AAT88589.1 hypothetical protein Lxx06350 [Leifsonia xyli subsp. xyli str. CTCB07]ODA90531.1 hypothetical protein ATY41_09830 [Leifsonia xyli subsp. xyli]